MKSAEQKRYNRKKMLILYLCIVIVLFIVIKTAEIKSFSYTITGKLMYSAILFNFLSVWYFVYRSHQSVPMRKSLVPIALTFTLAADFFLVLIDRFWIAGVILFCMVQTLYAIQLERFAACHFKRKKTVHTAASIGSRIVLFLIFVYVLYRVSYLEPLTAFAVLSMALLTMNVVFAWLDFSKEKTASSFFFALGLLLFAGCDLSLGLRNFSADVSGLDTLNQICAFSIWIFYVPSQAAIVTSEYFRLFPQE